jgi:hypothetical protein
MSTRRRLSMTLLFAFGLLGVSAAEAENPQCYTLAGLQGSYAIIGNYGANVAMSLGMRVFDGNGNVTGSAIINEPTAGSTTGARTIVATTTTGTYTVNCDGTGQITRFSRRWLVAACLPAWKTSSSRERL